MYFRQSRPVIQPGRILAHKVSASHHFNKDLVIHLILIYALWKPFWKADEARLNLPRSHLAIRSSSLFAVFFRSFFPETFWNEDFHGSIISCKALWQWNDVLTFLSMLQRVVIVKWNETTCSKYYSCVVSLSNPTKGTMIMRQDTGYQLLYCVWDESTCLLGRTEGQVLLIVRTVFIRKHKTVEKYSSLYKRVINFLKFFV